jgi:prepilin-type N-terminal cleavage/methylation domain-containing protein
MQRSSKPAFTVIELLIVIVILGILATIIWPRVRNRGRSDAVPARLVQVAPADSMLAPGASREVIVRAENPEGRPMESVEVRFGVTGGGGRVDPATVRTDRDGLAIVQWTLGASAGPNMLTATVEGMQGPPLSVTRVADSSVRSPSTEPTSPSDSPSTATP